MPASRQPRLRRRADADSPELVAALNRLAAVIAFKEACHEQAWADGARSCGEAGFAAAEAAVIASGYARPPQDWFAHDPILDDWLRA